MTSSHISSLRSQNRSLTADSVTECFEDVCGCSMTDNKTTSMYSDASHIKEVMEKRGVTVTDQVIAACSVGDNSIYTPTLVSLLQAAVSGEKKVFALIIVDVQNDFISGSLAVNEGENIVPVINNMFPFFTHVYKTADWHPANHISFHPNVVSGLHPTSPKSVVEGKSAKLFESVLVQGPPELNQTMWPIHCVQGSDGAKFHSDLKEINNETRIEKGMNPQVDSYSAFWDNGDTSHTLLYSLLVKQGVTDVVVCGLATDYCVGFTALDAARHGFRTVVVEDAVRGVADVTTKPMIERCKAAGVEFVPSKLIPGILKATDNIDTEARILRIKQHFSCNPRTQ